MEDTGPIRPETGLAELQKHFDRSDIAFTSPRILTQSTRGSEFEASPEQREALVTAPEMGYYDIPRRTNQSTVAERFDTTTPSASERFRRAISSLTEQTLLVGGSAERETPDSEETVTKRPK